MEMRPFPVRRVALRCLALLLVPLLGAAEPRIGSVKTFRPEASVLRQGSDQPLAVGTEIFRGDTVVTRSEGAVGITFIDGTVLSLGPETRFVLDDFVFRPAERDVSFVSQVMQGTATFLSGAIGRIAPEAVKIRTPTAVLGLRGTKILVEVK